MHPNHVEEHAGATECAKWQGVDKFEDARNDLKLALAGNGFVIDRQWRQSALVLNFADRRTAKLFDGPSRSRLKIDRRVSARWRVSTAYNKLAIPAVRAGRLYAQQDQKVQRLD